MQLVTDATTMRISEIPQTTALWSHVELAISEGRHNGVVVRCSQGGRIWVYSASLGGCVDSNTFERLGMKVCVSHPSMGSAVTVRLEKGPELRCLVVGLLQPVPHVRLQVDGADEMYDSRTFQQLGIAFSYMRCDRIATLAGLDDSKSNGLGLEDTPDGIKKKQVGTKKEATIVRKPSSKIWRWRLRKRSRNAVVEEEEEVIGMGNAADDLSSTGRKRRRSANWTGSRELRSTKL